MHHPRVGNGDVLGEQINHVIPKEQQRKHRYSRACTGAP